MNLDWIVGAAFQEFQVEKEIQSRMRIVVLHATVFTQVAPTQKRHSNSKLSPRFSGVEVPKKQW